MKQKQKLTTTLKLLKKHDACKDGYKKLVKFLGENYGNETPINLLTILESNGVEDCLLSLRAVQEDSDKIARLMAADFAESVLHFYTAKYPDDKRPTEAIKKFRDYANGIISGHVRISASADRAAYTALVSAHSARDAAAYTANAAALAAASGDNVFYAAAYAVRAAARAAGTQGVAAEEEKQKTIIKSYLIED
jgi:hypothetical protein